MNEAIALNQNRILVRLRSRHATLCNFKKKNLQGRKIIPQLYAAINDLPLAQISGVIAPVFAALKAEIEELHVLFARLESLTTLEAKSDPGLKVIASIVITCQHVHARRILHQVLARSRLLNPDAGAKIAVTITKLNRYFSVSRFLLQAAQKYSVFSRIRISVISFRAPKLARMELDPTMAGVIDDLLEGPKRRTLTSKLHVESSTAIHDCIRQGATLAVPVHAEIQLLFYYENSFSSVPPRIICSSKQACFLCNLFFKIHSRFIIPSTHGRLYEKWALPAAVKSMGENAEGNILTVLESFVSAIDNVLTREMRLTGKPNPTPYESMILLSAACSQSNQSTATFRGPMNRSSTSHEMLRYGDSTTIPHTNTITRTDSPVLSTVETQTQTESRDPVLHSRSKLDRPSFVPTRRSPSPLKALSEHSGTFRGTTTNTTASYIPLKKGQPIWHELNSVSQSFKASTPRIHLTISYDETLSAQQSQEAPQNVVARIGRYWIILEFLPDNFIPQGENVPVVNLLHSTKDWERTLDYGNADSPKQLCVRRDSDVISITYSFRKPVEE